VRIDFNTLVPPERWARHTENLENLLRSLEEAEVHAAELRLLAEVEARRQRGIS